MSALAHTTIWLYVDGVGTGGVIIILTLTWEVEWDVARSHHHDHITIFSRF